MECLLGFRGKKEVRVLGVMVGGEEGGLRKDWMDPGWRGHPEVGQSDQQGNRGERGTHLGLKRMPFLEKGTGLDQPKNLGRACGDGQCPHIKHLLLTQGFKHKTGFGC